MKALTSCCQNSSMYKLFIHCLRIFFFVNRDRYETVNGWIGQHIRIYNVSNINTGVRSGFRISPQDTQISIAESILPFAVSLLIGKGKPANLEDYLKPFL